MKTTAIQEALQELLVLGGLKAVPKVAAAVAELTAIDTRAFGDRNPWVVKSGPCSVRNTRLCACGAVIKTKGECP